MSSRTAMFLAVPVLAFALVGCAGGANSPDSGFAPDSPGTNTTVAECVEVADGALEASSPEFLANVPTPDCLYSMQGGYTALYFGMTDITEITSALTADGWADLGDGSFQKSEKTVAQVFTDKEATGTDIDVFEPPYVVLSAYSLD